MTINSPRQLKDWINNRAKVERNSTRYLDDYAIYLESISKSPELEKLWNDYRRKYPYAKDIEFTQIIRTIGDLLA
ncbi:MAG: hypothetical protein PWP30_862 [Eubacteriaceae bacterium]|nr:hypothetical protein [Eubacteriaceae bacterium]